MAATATFPAGTPLPINVDMFLGGDWHDVAAAGDVYQRNPVSITRGQPSATSSPTPSACSFTLDNRSGNYDPANPNSIYYGPTFNVNTLCRVAIGAEKDTFNRTVAAGSWGTNDSGDTYTYATAGGNSTAAFAVASGFGMHTVLHTGAAYAAALTANAFYADADVAVTVTVLAGTAVAGAQIEPANIILRAVDATHYYLFRVAIQPSGAVTGQWIDGLTSTAMSDAATATVTHAAASLRIRAQVEGQTLRGKVWDASGAEPAGWLVLANYMDTVLEGTIAELDSPGPVGVRSGVASGNTNASPIVFSYDNLTVRIPRWAGYLSLAPTTDITGRDKFVTATGQSVLGQLQNGSSPPVSSPLAHDIPSLPHLVAYWPMEDGAQATQFASAFPAGVPMSIQGGTPQLAASTAFVGSAALPTVNGAYFLGKVNPYTPTGAAQLRALVNFPTAGTLANNVVVMRMHSTGSVIRWDVYYGTGGNLGVKTFDNTGTQVNDTGLLGFNCDGAAVRLSLEVAQSGGNLSCNLVTLDQNLNGGGFTFTVTGQTLTCCSYVAIGPPGNDLSSAVVGQVTVESQISDIFDLFRQLTAFKGENVTDRMARLCGYVGIEFDYIADEDCGGQHLGPQPAGTLMDLLNQCVTTDQGALYEAKGHPALVYLTGGAHMRGPAQPVPVALDRAQHQLSAAPASSFDPTFLQNDVTASQVNGSSYEVEQTTGPLSTALPPAGAGAYPATLTVNLDSADPLQDLATWAVHVGTWPPPRIPSLSLNLASPHLTGSPSLWWALLEMDIDDLITLAGQWPDVVPLMIRGYTEQLNALSYDMLLNCAPGGPFLVPVLDDGVSRYDSEQSFLTASINATAASLSVTVLDGSLWTTSGSDLPFDIMLGGEHITVGAVTGAASPQTFSSLTRSVNGVVKGHTHGDQITLFTPVYYALGVD